MAWDTVNPSMSSNPEKVLTGHLCDQMATSLETLGRLPRQRPRDRYPQIADQPFRRQRKTVSAWTIIRLSRHCSTKIAALTPRWSASGWRIGNLIRKLSNSL